MKKNYTLGKKNHNWSRIWLITGIVTAAVVLLAIIGIRIIYQRNLQPISASQRTIAVTIPVGTGIHDIATKLEEQGVIKSSWAFEWYVRNKDIRDRLQAGTYSLRPSQSVPEIVNIMTQGKVATNLITILPGQRLDQIRSALINNGGFSATSVDEALKADNYLDHPALVDKPHGANLEGYLYPDSYQRIAETKPEAIIRAALDEMHNHATPEIRAAITKQGLTMHEGIILASIVEQEVGNPEDKPKVAQVFLRRLREGMALQSDITGIYGALKDGKEPSLTYDSAYNTHFHKGLPPTPISNISQSSLEAIARPAKTDFLYFVAGDDGITYFSHTLKEHEALVEKHCKKLCNI
jgi:UPF0755 protein